MRGSRALAKKFSVIKLRAKPMRHLAQIRKTRKHAGSYIARCPVFATAVVVLRNLECLGGVVYDQAKWKFHVEICSNRQEPEASCQGPFQRQGDKKL